MHHTTIWPFSRRLLKLFLTDWECIRKSLILERLIGFIFVRYCQNEWINDSKLIEQIIFSDECKHSLPGHGNKQHCQIWYSERPQQLYQRFIAPYLSLLGALRLKTKKLDLEWQMLAGENYKNMFFYYAFQRLRKKYQEHIIFQHNGDPAHFSAIVRQFSEQNLQERWI